MSTTPRHPIRVVARRTGLTPATLRAWERRYAAVEPARSGTERRLYSDLDIERLRLIDRLARGGRSLGSLAPLSLEELRTMADSEPQQADPPPRLRLTDSQASTANEHLAHARAAAAEIDMPRLHAVLMRAVVELDPSGFTDGIVGPLLQSVGEQWAAGSLSIAHEHAASATVRLVLGWYLETLQQSAIGLGLAPVDAPRLVATTPAGERHELGAMLCAITAAALGWRVTYLGPDTPADTIVSAVRHSGARLVALSVVSDAAGPGVLDEVRRLREALGAETEIVIGGAAARSLVPVGRATGITHLPTLGALRLHLRRLMPPPAPLARFRVAEVRPRRRPVARGGA